MSLNGELLPSPLTNVSIFLVHSLNKITYLSVCRIDPGNGVRPCGANFQMQLKHKKYT